MICQDWAENTRGRKLDTILWKSSFLHQTWFFLEKKTNARKVNLQQTPVILIVREVNAIMFAYFKEMKIKSLNHISSKEKTNG